MPPFIDLTGEQFGHLTVIKQVQNIKYTSWECRCSCGNIATITTNSLRTKKTKSCGCLSREVTKKRMTTHGMYGSPEHRAWRHMKERCYNPNAKDFKNYGARGIKVCKKWRKSFMAFFNYIGKKPHKNFSIDRINNNGNYCPGNVRWTNRKTQANNSRRNCLITIDGVTKNIIQWAETMGISKLTICNRLHMGWPHEKAILHPVRHLRTEIIKVDGISHTTKQWAKLTGIPPNAITKRLSRGWNPKDAVSLPLKKQ